MSRFAIIAADGMVNRIVETDDPDSLNANTPSDCSAVLAPDVKIVPSKYKYLKASREFIQMLDAPMAMSAMEGDLLDLVDQYRGYLQMTHLTRGTGVAQEYVSIQFEYRDYKSILPNLLTALNLTDRQKRFPTAMTEVALSGRSLDQVMASYGLAIAANDVYNRTIGRIAVHAKNRIRAAKTWDDKKKIYDTINWNWTPGF